MRKELLMSQAVQQASVSREALRQAIERGVIRARQVGRIWMLDAADVAAYKPNQGGGGKARGTKGKPHGPLSEEAKRKHLEGQRARRAREKGITA